MNDKNTTEAVKEVLFGLFAYFIVASVPVLIFTKDKLKGEGGLIAGTIVAVIMLLSMSLTVEKAVHHTGNAQAYMGIMSALRLLMVGVFLFVIVNWDLLNPITAFVGLMGLKLASYGQPFVHRLFHGKEPSESESPACMEWDDEEEDEEEN